MSKLKCPYPTTEILGAMIRAGDKAAVDYVIAQVREHDGNLTAAAAAMGVSHRVLYYWRDANERLGAAFDKHGLGRAGAAKNASRIRAARRSD